MIEVWLDLPTAGLFGVLVAIYAATAAAIVWLACGKLTGPGLRHFDGIVAPFPAAIGVLFALLTGFLAGDIGDRNRQAARAVQSEASELHNVYALSVASVSDMRNIRAALTAYVNAMVADEWPAMAEDRASDATAAAYDALLHEVSDPTIAQEAGPAVHTALLSATVRAGTARSDRLALAADRTNEIKWALVLILGVMTQISIGLVHLTKRNAEIAALAVFTAAAVTALGMIAMQERPFAGDFRIVPGPVAEIAKLPVQ